MIEQQYEADKQKLQKIRLALVRIFDVIFNDTCIRYTTVYLRLLLFFVIFVDML